MRRRDTTSKLFLSIAVLMACGFAVGAPPSRATNEPPASAGLRAEEMLLSRCGICHSTDLVTQQRLDRARWTATVDKMIRWGAPLSPEERNALVIYLAAQYHPQAPIDVKPNDAK